MSNPQMAAVVPTLTLDEVAARLVEVHTHIPISKNPERDKARRDELIGELEQIIEYCGECGGSGFVSGDGPLNSPSGEKPCWCSEFASRALTLIAFGMFLGASVCVLPSCTAPIADHPTFAPWEPGYGERVGVLDVEVDS